MRDDYRTVSGAEKAALLLMTLGETHSANIFALMDDDEIREISQTMANLGTVSSDLIERLLVEFADQVATTGNMVGNYDNTERLLLKVMDKDRVDAIMEEIRGPAGRNMWEKLANVNENVLANYLKNEYPQTVAVVLSKIRAEHASRVLALLPENLSMEVIMRMLSMEAVQKDVLDDIERTLRTEFMSNLARTSRRDSHELMAEIFNFFDRNVEARFMTSLEENSKDSAERIKALMFTFDDLGAIDPGGVQVLLRATEKDRLATALKGASKDMRQLFFSNMSKRAVQIMQEDMEAMGPVRLKDVDEAQMYMVTVAKDLASRGEIMLSDAKEDDQLIY